MDENFRPKTPPASPDLAAAEGCGRNELTRSNSDSSSSVTIDSSKNFLHLKTYARPFTAWTDEKHNSYLEALEASFVNQLHQNMGLLSWCSGQNKCDPSPSQQLPINTSYSSDRFTVLRDGSWQEINFEKKLHLPYSAAGSHVVKESSWIHHFRCPSKHITNRLDDLRECSMFCSEGISFRGKRILSYGLTSLGQQGACHKCHLDAVGTIAEVSDQNFVDDDREEKSSSWSTSKRLKMAASDDSTKDQIVPSGNLFTGEISTASNTSPERASVS